MQRVVFNSTGWAIDFAGCERVVDGIPQVFEGWSIAAGRPDDFPAHAPRAVISRAGDGWTWQERGAPKSRHWDSKPPRSEMRVLTEVHDAAIYWYLAENPELLCLHGAATRIGDGLVCFPARGFTGKSTLTAHLAALGHRVYSDDVLGLEGADSTGVALGFMPRLRSGLPPTIAPEIRRYIADHQGPSSDGWTYLRPGPRQIAGLGEKAPVKAVILLQREDDAAPSLEPVNTASVLRILIAENIIRQLPMTAIFDRLHALAGRCRRYRLRYGDPLAAARFLAETFA